MIKFILGLAVMFLVGYLFNKIKPFITKNVISTLKGSKKEKFEFKKLLKIFDLTNLVEWIKSLKEIGILDVRKWMIVLFIAGIVYGYGWYKGKLNAPVQIPFDYTTEYKMKIDGHFLYKSANSNDLQIVDKNGNVIKDIKLKDFPAFAKKLRPIAFELKPIGIFGGGVGGDKNGFEAGAGISFIRYWKWRLETFLTNRGGYLGTSRKITNNSAIGIATGKGYKGENRAILYYRWEF